MDIANIKLPKVHKILQKQAHLTIETRKKYAALTYTYLDRNGSELKLGLEKRYHKLTQITG